MMEALQEYWHAITGSTVVASVIGWFGVDTIKTVRRMDREKADRSELHRFMDLMEQRDALYRKDQEKSSDSRGDMHKKIDGVIEKLNETNVQLARLAGRLNGESR